MSARNAQPLILKDPAELRPHPLKKALPKCPEWQKGGEEFHRLLDDIHDRGIDRPLLITGEGLILDGEIVWQAAKQLQLAEVPCVVTAADPASVILGSLLRRRHLTKSALAYICYPLFGAAHEEARKRRLEKLRKGQQIPVSHAVGNGDSAADLAERVGVSRALFDYASRLHARFARDIALRAEWEPKILNGEVALGAALAGMAGGEAGGPRIGNQLLLFTDGFETICKRFTYWKKFDEVTREKARETIHKTVAEMPDDLRDEFERAIRDARKAGHNNQRRVA